MRFTSPRVCPISYNNRQFHSIDPIIGKPLQKPAILNAEAITRSRLFIVKNADLESGNGVRRVYGRMRPTNQETVMIVPIAGDHLIPTREYAVKTESYELSFSKGLTDLGESVFGVVSRELKEEIGFGADDLTFSKKLSMAPSCFSGKVSTMAAQDLYPESLGGDGPEPLSQVR